MRFLVYIFKSAINCIIWELSCGFQFLLALHQRWSPLEWSFTFVTWRYRKLNESGNPLLMVSENSSRRRAYYLLLILVIRFCKRSEKRWRLKTNLRSFTMSGKADSDQPHSLQRHSGPKWSLNPTEELFWACNTVDMNALAIISYQRSCLPPSVQRIGNVISTLCDQAFHVKDLYSSCSVGGNRMGTIVPLTARNIEYCRVSG